MFHQHVFVILLWGILMSPLRSGHKIKNPLRGSARAFWHLILTVPYEPYCDLSISSRFIYHNADCGTFVESSMKVFLDSCRTLSTR